MGSMWKSNIPLKIKVFLWQMFIGRLQTGVCLKSKGWKGSNRCALCGGLESVDHVFFQCSLARFAWCIIKDCYGWDCIPASVSDFFEVWVPRNLKLPHKMGLFFFAGLAWSIWNIRNKMTIEKKFPNPTDVLFSGIAFLQKWKVLLKESDAERVKTMTKSLLDAIKNRSSLEFVSDIVVL